MWWTGLRGPVALMATALVVALIALSSSRGAQGRRRGELLDYYDSLPPYTGYGGYSRTVPTGGSFDYDRPDMADGGLDMSYMAGTTGSLVPFTGLVRAPMGEVTAVGGGMWGGQGRGGVVDTMPVVPVMMIQDRAGLDDGFRADAARCNGLMHACANWMALQTGKMRFAVYQEGSWCTDEKINQDTCAEEGRPTLSNEILDVPEEGGALSDALWTTLTLSCPVLKGCAKPKAMSFTETTSQYAQPLAPVLSQVQAYRASRAQATQAGLQCCIARQTALRALSSQRRHY